MPTVRSGASRNLRKYLAKQQMLQESLAERVGVSIFAVRKWLNGERIPRDKTKLKIAQVTDGAIKVQDWVSP